MIGIYCIENRIHGKRYIGQTTNIKRRFNDHKSALRRNDHENVHLQRAWNKVGEESFEFSILETCLVNEMDSLENYYISKFQTTVDRFGYNLESGGNRNKSLSNTTRQKISISRKIRGNTMSEQYLSKLSKRMKGNKYRVGKKMPEDNKQKLIQVHMGNKYTLGYKHTDENRKKMSEQRKGNTYRKGIPHTEEAKRKISEGSKKFWKQADDKIKKKMLSNLTSYREPIEDC